MRLRHWIGVSGIFLLFSLSFLFFDSAKYDTAVHLRIPILLGIFSIFIPFFFGFEGIKKNPMASLPLALWSIFIWASWYFSQTKNYGFSEAAVLSSLPFLGLGVAGLTDAPWKSLQKILVFFALISVLHGFWYFPLHGEDRMAGLFYETFDYRHFFPNAFANFLLLTWPLAFFGTLASTKARRLASAFVLSLLLTGLILTFSRGAWAIFILQTVIIFFCARKTLSSPARRHFFLQCLLVVVGAILLSVFLFTLRSKNFSNVIVKEKIIFQNSERLTSLNERREFWKGSLELITQEPWKGFGPMSFRYIFPSVQRHFLAISDHPHNWIIKIAVENGLPAAVAFIAFLMVVTLPSLLRKKEIPEMPFLLGAFVGGFSHTLIDYNMNFIPNAAAFFILAGGMMRSTSGQKEKKLWLPATALWSMILLFTFAMASREAFASNTEKSFMPREWFLQKADLAFSNGNATEARGWLARHLALNTRDAAAYARNGDFEKALKVDSMNFFYYYRRFYEMRPALLKQDGQKIKKLLVDYEAMLDQNLHYTAFTGNPEEAAKLYELLGDQKRARTLREKTEILKNDIAERENFQKKLAPHSLQEWIKSLVFTR